MGNIGVIRKEAGVALSPGGGIQQIWMPGQSNEPQRFAGVTGGIGDLQRHPVTQQYEAAPIMSKPDNKGNQTELGYREGDKYGARGLNINQKFNQNPDFDYSQQIGPMTADRGQQIADQMARRGAQQKVFDRSAKYGQRGANVGRGLAAGIGVLAGAVNLANAGAQGQDALTGGLGAAQMGSMAYQQGKKPLAEAGGEVGAQVGARSVKVAEPTAAKQYQPPDAVGVAAPNPAPQLTQEQKDHSRRFSADKSRDPTDEAAARAKYNVGVLYSGRDASQNMHPADDYHGALSRQRIGEQQQQDWNAMGMPPANFTGTIGNQTPTASPTPDTFATGSNPVGQLNLQGDVAQNYNQTIPGINEPQVAPATTAQSGAVISNELNTQSQLPKANPQQTGEIIAAAKNPAAEATDTEASMASQGIGKMVGVSGSKKIVGVI